MRRLLALLLCLTYITGCSTSPAANTDRNTDYDLSKVESYYIIGDENIKNPMISDIDRNRFNKAIDNEFSLNGLVNADNEAADVHVRYFVVTKDKVRVTSTGQSGYYGNNLRYGRAYGYNYAGPNLNTKKYTEGTFVIDIIDNKSNETVWRSTLVKPMKKYETAEEREQAVIDLINIMFVELNN